MEMFCGKNEFPTSALHLLLNLNVVYLDPHKVDESGNCLSTTHYTGTEYKTITFGTETTFKLY